MKQLILVIHLFVLTLLTVPKALAHDFWLAPETFTLASPGQTKVKFLIGHHGHVEPWDLQQTRVVTLEHHHSQGSVDMAANVIPQTRFADGFATTSTLKEGTNVIGFVSAHSTSTLAASKFNQYVEDAGLLLVAEHRIANGTEDSAGVEIYSRRAKAVVQVGNTLSDNVLAPLGHTLEILPLQHTGSLQAGEKLNIKVLFDGKPLSGAKVTLEVLNSQDKFDLAIVTNDRGQGSLNIPSTGEFKLNTIWGVPLESHPIAEFETYFSSLTFSI